MKSRARGLVSALLLLGLILPVPASAAPDSLRTDSEPPYSDDGVRRGYHSETGKLSFIGADPDSAIVVPNAQLQGMSARARSDAMLAVYGPEFGLTNHSQELQVIESYVSERSRSTTRYQQVFNGIPIIAGELIINQDSEGGLISISGEISPDLSLSTEPDLSIESARDISLGVVAKKYGLTATDLFASTPELWIYDARLLRPSSWPAALVWRMDVVGVERTDIRELVLVDAQTGGIALRFNQVDAALDRDIYDNQNNSAFGLPGNGPVRTEGGGATGITEVDRAYDYSGDTYDFFATKHGRDSLDDAGMTLISTVRYCPDAANCPFANAFWNGTQMVYGDGFAGADDVVGHELTHGVTNFTSDLFYYYQSGAISESFSDVWGEFIDQTNSGGTDTPAVKWLMGEDVPVIGAIRDMENPPTYDDPDKMSSAFYYEASAENFYGTGDNGGVHTNSGVNNKAAFLMTDGGSFNGQTVSALGIDKVAAIYYEVQTNLLTSGSDYGDLYNALYQACLNLVGGAEGITSGNCQEVRDATDAVEMDDEPDEDYNPEAEICSSGETPIRWYYDDLESGSGSWTFDLVSGTSNWTPATGYATSGTSLLWGNDYNGTADLTSDSYAMINVDIPLPAGKQSYLHFNHAFGFEDPDWDGGWLEYSTDGGANWFDAGSMFDDGLDYTGSIFDPGPVPGANPNRGHVAFIGDSHGYVSSRYDLLTLAGEDVRFRWRMSTDKFVYDWGWFVDDVMVYTCVGQSFNDVPNTHWAFEYIEAIFQHGFVAGCLASPRMYCPETILNRSESSVFILRGKYGAIADHPYPDPPIPSFADVDPAYWGYGWIESLYTDGFTAGCGTDPLIYCPFQQHNRAEASVFFLRIKNGVSYVPPAPSGIFADVPSGVWYEKWVEAAYNQGLLPECGTGPLWFCPFGPLDRAWAAFMMVQAKGLMLP